MLEDLKTLIGNELFVEYMNFIKENACNKIKGKTERHHILPKSIFPKYDDFRKYPENFVHLSFSDHFYAHYILAKSHEPKFAVIFRLNCLNGKIPSQEMLENYNEIKIKAAKEIGIKVSEYRNNLSKEEKEILKFKISEGVKKFLQSVDNLFFIKRSKKYKETVNNKTIEEMQLWTNKIITTRCNNNSYVTGGIKAAETKRNNVDENGKNDLEKAAEKMVETRRKNGSFKTGALKGKETKLNDIDENGLNSYQRSAKKGLEKKDIKNISLKAAETMKNTFDENGINLKEKRLKKRHETMSKIDDDGLSGYQKARLKQDKTVYYNVIIYNSNDEIIQEFKKSTKKDIFEQSIIPMTIFWYLKGVYIIGKHTNKNNIKFEGFYIKRKRINND